MSVVQRKAMLKAEGFFPHKKNAKGTTIIYSRKHPTAKFVRVVVDSGIDSKTGKVVGKVGIKLCFVNRQKSWREITTQIFTTNTGLVKTIKAQEAAEKFVKTCKHCKAKKFTAKSGNVVCANACWTTWGGKKKSQNTTKKTTQKKSPTAQQKNPQKVTPKNHRTYPLNKRVGKKSQKKAQKIVAEILPGDLVSIERIELDQFKEDYTGKVLGIVMSVTGDGRVNVNWTANTSNLESYDLPFTNHYSTVSRHVLRIKVLSRSVEWAEAA
tara:strand:- start:337 stop:1140 length:804 start_codon:yes stop_codon:yes gene_type:complete